MGRNRAGAARGLWAERRVKRVLLDTGVILYALGGRSTHAEPCRRVLELAGTGAFALEAPVSLVQEVLHHRMQRMGDRAQAGADALAVASVCILHVVEPSDARAAVELFERWPELSARAAMLVAVAHRHGLEAILTVNGCFDDLPRLRRVDPSDEAAVAALIE